jgi:hypothetical protein
MKKYLKIPLVQILIILLVSVLTSMITFLLITKNQAKFIESTYQAFIAAIGIIGAFLVTREVENSRCLANAKKSEMLIMRLLEDELQQNIDIYNSQYKSEALSSNDICLDKRDQFAVDKWASIQISMIQIRDLFYDKDLFSEILFLYSNFNRINYLIRNNKILESGEKKIIFRNMEQLIWKVFSESIEYNKALYKSMEGSGLTAQVNTQESR